MAGRNVLTNNALCPVDVGFAGLSYGKLLTEADSLFHDFSPLLAQR